MCVTTKSGGVLGVVVEKIEVEDAAADTGENVTLSGGASQITATVTAAMAHKTMSTYLPVFLAELLLGIRSSGGQRQDLAGGMLISKNRFF